MDIGEETGSMPDEESLHSPRRTKIVFKESDEAAKSRLIRSLTREICIGIKRALEREGGYRDWESLYEGHRGRPVSTGRSIKVKTRKEAIKKAMEVTLESLKRVKGDVNKLCYPSTGRQ